MKHLLIAFFVAILGFWVIADSADAASRFGGGRSSGIQRSVPMKRDVAPSQNAPRPAQPAPQPAGASRWLGPIAGLAAGLGLMALASYLGLSEELATFAMLLLIAIAVFFVIRLLLRRFAPQRAPLQYAGGPPAGIVQRDAPTLAAGAGEAANEMPLNLPRDFDAESFIRHAKLNFVRLQAANDAHDMEDIRQFTTPEMYAEIKVQMQERVGAPQKTDVVTLEAELLDFNTEFRRQIASVRFHGTIREGADSAPEPFDEIWHITKPVDGDRNWAIAGIQQAG